MNILRGAHSLNQELMQGYRYDRAEVARRPEKNISECLNSIYEQKTTPLFPSRVNIESS
jgi:hypothetical protein